MNDDFKPFDLPFAREDDALKKENDILKSLLDNMRAELEKFKAPPLIVCEVKKIMDDKAIVKLSNGHHFYVPVSKHLVSKIKPFDQVIAEQKSLTIIDIIDPVAASNAEKFIMTRKPDVTWKDIGGMKDEIRELREVIELPLQKPELFKKVGINPPKGVLLHGPPGCGKTLLAKAVAESTNAAFIEIVASELVQKFIGDGARLVRELFDFAKKNAPAIIFIDEIDALAALRMEMGTSGEREVQRTFMQFLAEVDGFKSLDDVKLIGATNRLDIIDPALLRPGRFDRVIEVGYPDFDGRLEILKIHTKNMNLKEVNLEMLAEVTKDYSGAEIKSLCTEAGYVAIRENRTHVTMEDFLDNLSKVKEPGPENANYVSMFG